MEQKWAIWGKGSATSEGKDLDDGDETVSVELYRQVKWVYGQDEMMEWKEKKDGRLKG